MNHSQKNYLSQRIDQILRSKIEKVRKTYTVELSNQQKYNLIKEGKVKLLPFDGDRYGFEAKFDFSEFQKDAKYAPIFQAKVEDLEEKAQKIKDEAFLGDCTKAMELLKSFEKDN